MANDIPSGQFPVWPAGIPGPATPGIALNVCTRRECISDMGVEDMVHRVGLACITTNKYTSTQD